MVLVLDVGIWTPFGNRQDMGGAYPRQFSNTKRFPNRPPLHATFTVATTSLNAKKYLRVDIEVAYWLVAFVCAMWFCVQMVVYSR